MSIQQKEVLRVLVEHEGEWLSEDEIDNLCKISGINIHACIIAFMGNDWIYTPDGDGKVTVSPEGKRVYRET